MAAKEINTDKRLDLFLQSWWSRTYNRPLKDPILTTYTTEELLYEYYDRYEREKIEHKKQKETDDKIDDSRIKETLDWAEQEEKAELEKLAAEKGVKPEELLYNPMNDPSNKEWVEKQLAAEKEFFGEDYGQDIDEDFTG